MIEFRGVSKRFPDGTLAVADVDIVIPPHKTTVLVGLIGFGQDHAASHDQSHGRPDFGARC